jgi:formate-dependent nitrite reductase cytochrome c552 subunit
MTRNNVGVVRILVIVIALPVLIGAGCPFTPSNTLPPGAGNAGLTGKFVGSERCSQCHQSYHTSWADTLHAKALERLEAAGQGTNAECLVCHTVGFGQEGGFKDRATTNALAGVGCESCHGPGGDHVANVTDVNLRPKVDISAAVCGACHTGAHQPNYDQWQLSRHAVVTPTIATRLVAGTNANDCGQCHSGDARYLGKIKNQAVPADALKGRPIEGLNAITCAICHNPHAKTSNAAVPEEGRDYQLRYPELLISSADNTILGTQDESRFNICGQCHHDRGSTYKSSTSRGPHHSVQGNVYLGEMAVPNGESPLVQSANGPHNLAAKQCATCHVHREPFMSDENPTQSGHEFTVNFAGCALSGCHQTADAAQALAGTLQTAIQNRLNALAAGLGNVAMWEYSSSDYGGPANQNVGITADARLKQLRFIYHYVLNDQSLGVHNPDYVRALLTKAEELLNSLKTVAPTFVLPFP